MFRSLANWLTHTKVNGDVTLEKEEISAGQLITVGELTLLPIIRTYMSCQKVNKGIACFGSKIPIGIIVISPSWRCVLTITGEEVPLDQYIEQVPEVKELLQNI